MTSDMQEPSGIDFWKLSKLCDRIFSQLRTKSFEQLECELRDLEANAASESRALMLKARRNIAERIFYIAIEKKMPKSTCLKLRRRIKRMGYSDNMQQHEVDLTLARYLIAIGEKRSAFRILSVLKKYSGVTNSQAEESISDLRQSIDTLLKRTRE